MEQAGTYISFKDFIKAIGKRYMLVVLITVLCISAAILYRMLVAKPVYEAKASIIIGLKPDIIQYANIDIDKNMLTCVKLFKTNMITSRIVSDLKLDVPADKLIRRISTEHQDGTQIIDVSIKWDDRYEASMILDKLISVFTEEADRIFPMHNIYELDRVPPKLFETLDVKLYYGAAFAAGLLMSLFIVLIAETTDNTLKTEEDIEKYLDLPVIGTIPLYKKAGLRRKKLMKKYLAFPFKVSSPKEAGGYKSYTTEFLKKNDYTMLDAFRILRTNLYYISGKYDARTIIVTSAKPGEGKSSAASMLAIVLAQDGKKTLLVDCDMRKPTIHEFFDIDKIGLSNILMASIKWTEGIMKSKVDNLFIMPAGYKPLYPVELISSEDMRFLVRRLNEEFDYIILDTPPVGLFTEAQVLSEYADGYLIVVSAGRSDKESVMKAIKLIRFAGGRILGVLLNCTSGTVS